MAVRSLLAPWPGKTGRSLTVLGPTAAAEYAAAVGGIAAAVEAALSPDVHGGRVARLDPLSIEPWREALTRHRGIALDVGAGAGAALRIDVADCYRSIRVDVVEASLTAVGADPDATCRVVRFLRRTTAAGIPGLPVGPEPSAVLANAVLHRLDRAAVEVGESDGMRSLRWFDDLLLLAPRVSAILRAEAEVEAEARALGLSLHAGKRRLAVGAAGVRRLAVGTGVASRCVLTAPDQPH